MASGSLPRFWEIDEYRELIPAESKQSIAPVPDLVQEEALRHELKKAEERRVQFRRRLDIDNDVALDCATLMRFVHQQPGPRLLIVNTVHTAAVVARAMRENGHHVLHLSTALAPAHRDLVVERVKLRLREKIEDWTLVATSCVESGMNLSFRTGFRERASTASLIQVGGRVSRGDEHEDAEVWDLLLRDDLFRQNPALKVSRQALDRFSEHELNNLTAAELATRGMQREWTAGAEERARELIQGEIGMEYPTVGKLCRVIDSDTLTVVIDRALVMAIRSNEKMSNTELLRCSVQMWANKVDHLGLEPIGRGRELYAWGDNDYDPDFLGYMAGVLSNEQFLKDGGAVI